MRSYLMAVTTVLTLLASSCAADHPAPAAVLFSGVWTGEAGDDILVFSFNEPGGDCPGVISCINSGKKYTEIPMTTVTWDHPLLEVFIAPTGVTYTGELQGETISGGIGDVPIDLALTDAAAVEGFSAVEGQYAFTPPVDMQDGIRTGSMDPQVAEALVDRVSAGDAGLVHSVLVYTGGELIFEEYFHGYSEDDDHRLMSSTKSIASLLTGIALDRGLIDSVTVPMTNFFPGFPEGITLEHLLMMSMGLSWSDDEAEFIHETGNDFFQQVSEMERISAPGESFRYVNADVNLLSGVLFQASGLYPDQFAEEYLFQPLGISEYDWSYGETDGHRLMDGSLHLRPRDMLKIGILVLQNGFWEDEQVVSQEWMAASTEPHLNVDEMFDYGYLWWLTEESGMEVRLASGWGSQFIAVIPEAETVIVTTGGNDDNGMNWRVLLLVSEALFGQRL